MTAHAMDDVEVENMDVQGYDKAEYATVGGKRTSRSRSKKNIKKTKGGKKSKKVKKTTRKHKKGGPSNWIKHVKAFCKKTGKTFPEALKDPMCRKSFKH